MRRRIDRWARRIGAAALLFALLPGTGLAQKVLYGQAILGFNLFDSSYLTAKGFDQLYDVGYDRQLSEPLHLHLYFRGQGLNSSETFQLTQNNQSFWLLQPTAEIDYMLPHIQFIGRYDFASTTSNYANNTQAKQLIQRGVGTLTWSPEDLPTLTLQGEQRRNQQTTAGIDQASTLLTESLFYQFPALTLGEVVQYVTQDLYNSDFHGTLFTAQATGEYSNAFLAGRLSVNANATAGWRQIQETVQSNDGASVPNQVTILAASYVHDETPLDSRDAPAAPTPTLTDNDFRTSSGISLGADATSFQNLVFDMGRFVALDTFQVFVRDLAGNLAPTGGLVTWDVYTSSNALDWVPAGAGQTRFLTSMAAYEVTFPSVRSRYFRIVSFGTNTVPTLVTEVQAFFHTQLAAETNRTTDVRFLNATAQVSGRPTDWLTLSYNGIFNDFKTQQPNRPEFASVDSDQFLSAEFLPTASTDLVLRYERREVQPSGQPDQEQHLQGYFGTLTYTYNPNLITTVEASKQDETGLNDIQSTTLRFTEYARLLKSFTLQLDGGLLNQDNRDTGITSKGAFADVVGYAQLTRTLQLGLNVNWQRTRDEGPAAGLTGGLERTFERYYVDLQYRPSGRLTLGARYGYTLTNRIRAQIRGFRVEWYPFAGGTVGIGTVYEEDVDANHEFRRFRRIQILPIWQINPHAALNVNYNYFTLHNSITASGPGTNTTARQFLVTLTLTL